MFPAVPPVCKVTPDTRTVLADKGSLRRAKISAPLPAPRRSDWKHRRDGRLRREHNQPAVDKIGLADPKNILQNLTNTTYDTRYSEKSPSVLYIHSLLHRFHPKPRRWHALARWRRIFVSTQFRMNEKHRLE